MYIFSFFYIFFSFFRYQNNCRYKLVKDFDLKDTQSISTFSAVNSFYSCIFFIDDIIIISLVLPCFSIQWNLTATVSVLYRFFCKDFGCEILPFRASTTVCCPLFTVSALNRFLYIYVSF